MTHNEAIDQLVASLGRRFLDEGGVVVLYGSRLESRDVDVLLVQEREPPSSVVVLGQLDIYAVSRSHFEHLMQLSDVHVTEPILTGELVHGDPERWIEVRDRLRSALPSSESVDHACRRAMVECLAAEQLWRDGGENQDTLRWSFQTLGFSVTYASFARWYDQGRSPCSVADMRAAGALLGSDYWEFQRAVKKGAATLTADSVAQQIRTWTRTLALSGKSP